MREVQLELPHHLTSLIELDRPSIGSLCAGYGGLSLAVEAVTGGKVEWVSDIDPGACKILEHRFPGVPNIGDMTTVDWSAVPPVDVLDGGTPCQDLSAAGRRAGMTEGTRSNLWVAMREAIAIIRPRLVIWENVRGSLSARASSASDLEPGEGSVGEADDGPLLRAIGRVLGDLSSLGYDTEWTTVPASAVGAPHRRERVFVLAQPSGNTPEEHLRKKPGRERVTDLAVLVENDLMETGGKLLPTPAAYDGSKGGSQHPAKRRAGGHQPSVADMVEHLTPTTETFGPYAPAIARWEAVLGRESPAPTELTAKGKHRLSARFVEWMMGLPDGWVTDVGLSRGQELRALGNGVVPQQAIYAVSWLLERAGVTVGRKVA